MYHSPPPPPPPRTRTTLFSVNKFFYQTQKSETPPLQHILSFFLKKKKKKGFKMERDFLGLNWKIGSTKMDMEKQTKEICTHDSETISTGMQWPLTNNLCYSPHYMQAAAAEAEDKNKKKKVFDSSLISPTPFFKSFHFKNAKPNPFLPQKQMDNPPNISSTTDFLGIERMGQQRNGEAKPPSSASLSQLTLVYADAVYVYDNVSPKYAEAILSLGGKGYYSKRDKFLESSMYRTGEIHINQAQPPRTRATTLAAAGGSNSSYSCFLKFAAMPQARRASLARFLKTRKDRLMNTTPYHNLVVKKSFVSHQDLVQRPEFFAHK